MAQNTYIHIHKNKLQQNIFFNKKCMLFPDTYILYTSAENVISKQVFFCCCCLKTEDSIVYTVWNHTDHHLFSATLEPEPLTLLKLLIYTSFTAIYAVLMYDFYSA